MKFKYTVEKLKDNDALEPGQMHAKKYELYPVSVMNESFLFSSIDTYKNLIIQYIVITLLRHHWG